RNNAEPTRHPKIQRADSAAITGYDMAGWLDRLKEALVAQDEERARQLLFSLIVAETIETPQASLG
ncbi:MAG: hypothetical protein H2046_09195, partial [Rhizobiales bacterium]|nr:hypothetical protein [Hyphomicrobiales bacterium]